MRKAAVLLGLMSIMMSCKTTKVQTLLPEEDARVIIYRTLKDYNHPVKELNAKIDGGLEGCRSLLIDKKRP